MSSQPKVRIKRTPNCRHPYTATAKGVAVYGWGNSPTEARAKLAEMIKRASEGTL